MDKYRIQEIRSKFFPGSHLITSFNAWAFRYSVNCSTLEDLDQARSVKPDGVVARIRYIPRSSVRLDRF